MAQFSSPNSDSNQNRNEEKLYFYLRLDLNESLDLLTLFLPFLFFCPLKH